jgi:hypothetical protein
MTDTTPQPLTGENSARYLPVTPSHPLTEVEQLRARVERVVALHTWIEEDDDGVEQCGECGFVGDRPCPTIAILRGSNGLQEGGHDGRRMIR